MIPNSQVQVSRQVEAPQPEATIRALESKLEDMSITQNRIAQENTELKMTVDQSERAFQENQSLRVANTQFQIEYDRLVAELRGREVDEENFIRQVIFIITSRCKTQLTLISIIIRVHIAAIYS